MKRTFLNQIVLTGVLAAAVAAASCTMKSQDAPGLTGPSGYGTDISVSVTPDIIFQDGASQSRVTVTASDQNGKPLANLSLRAEIRVGGVTADFGSLSARSIVTGPDGRATLVYTAPNSPSGPSVDNGTTVDVAVTPLGTDFNNTISRLATIRLIPTGVVVPPDGLRPYFSFTPTAPIDNQNVLFTACSDPAAAPCAPANNPIVTYSWNFGDGGTGSGRNASHSFRSPGTYAVTLTVTDAFNRSALTTQSINVGAGTGPAGSFVISPSAPRAGQTVVFDAAAVRPAPGRTIRTYTWSFGDGDTKTVTTPQTTHDYVAAGSYNVTLVTTDDAGRTATASGSVTVLGDNPTADFTFSPTGPGVGTPVNFNANGSSAVAGRTITSYSWSFGDGSSGSGPTPSRAYTSAGAYTVTLTVTDSAGKTGTVAKPVTVQ